MVAYSENYLLLDLSLAVLIYWEYKHFSVLFADDNETLGKLINALGINNKKRIMPHLLDEGDPAKMKEYGFIKAVKHQGSVYVVIHKGFKIRCSSVVEAICRATMMYFVLHVSYPSSAFAIYTFLSKMHGVIEKAKPKAGKSKKPDTQVDNPKLAAVVKRFFP